MLEMQCASRRNSPQTETPITHSELRMRWELTYVQKQKLNPILVARDDIRNFDYPPEDGEWVKNRSYQTREEAINAFADLTGITPEHATKIFDDQNKAHANVKHWEAALHAKRARGQQATLLALPYGKGLMERYDRTRKRLNCQRDQKSIPCNNHINSSHNYKIILISQLLS